MGSEAERGSCTNGVAMSIAKVLFHENKQTMSALPMEDNSTVQQMADLYNVTPKVFRRWLKPLAEEIGERVGHYFTPRQIEIMIRHFGLPLKFGKPGEAVSPPAKKSGEDEERTSESFEVSVNEEEAVA